MGMFVCVRVLCAACEDVKIGCMNTFCQSTLIYINDVVCNCKAAGATRSYCKHRGSFTPMYRGTWQCWCNIYIWSSFPTTVSSFNCFFDEVVISIMHIKFPSILPQHELMMDNDKSDNKTSNWNQFN